jgi:hypothetical protein
MMEPNRLQRVLEHVLHTVVFVYGFTDNPIIRNYNMNLVTFFFLVLIVCIIVVSLASNASDPVNETGQRIAVREFTNTNDYNEWLRRWGSEITILSVNTTKRWSLMTGFLGNAKTITVTYENTSREANV